MHGRAAVEWVASYLERVADLPVLSQAEPGQIRSALPERPPDEPEPFEAVLRDLDEVLLPGLTHWQSPHFFAYFATTGSEPGVLAELLILLAAEESFPAFDKVQKPEGDILDIVWTLKLMDEEGRVEPTSLAFPTKWFAKRLGRAFIADSVTFFHGAPLEDGLVAVAHEEGYAVKIVDPRRNETVRTVRRDYRRVKYEPEKVADPAGGARGLSYPLPHFNDIQKIYAVEGRIWAAAGPQAADDRSRGLADDGVGEGRDCRHGISLAQPTPKVKAESSAR